MALKPMTKEERRHILMFTLRYPRIGARKTQEMKQMNRRLNRRRVERDAFHEIRETLAELSS